MKTVEIVREINKLNLNEKMLVIELVLKNIRLESDNKLSLAESASAMLSDYENDRELTAFTALDKEDFYEAQ